MRPGNEYPSFFEQLQDMSFAVREGDVIAEHSCRLHLKEQFGQLARFRELKQGDSILSFYRI